jgi:hypothetical protein
MQGATPSEILEPLRNDGRSRHHRAEMEKAIAELARKLAEIKREAADTAATTEEVGGA